MLVLYKVSFAESVSYRSFTQALASHAEWTSAFRLIVVDNSPQAQPVPPEFTGEYVQDGANPGLAARYNFALGKTAGAGWLLLLDQDTEVTAEYLAEVLAATQAVGADVVAIVPKLVEHGALQSPHRPFYRGSNVKFGLEMHGVAPGLVRVYNSGAVVRVAAVSAIGGFPETYGLDYLDHATFHRLQAAGGKIHVLRAALRHEMSVNDAGRFRATGHAARHRGQLAAERRFYREHGSLAEQIRQRLDLFKQALRPIKHGEFAEAGRILRSVFGV